MTAPVIFFQRPFPNANMVLLTGSRPILYDSGFGSDDQTTIDLIQAAGAAPDRLQMVVNSHWHCDHTGGNHLLQNRYNVPIAAYHTEAKSINARDVDHAFDARWLVQPMWPYSVDQFLHDGDVLDTGMRQWQVIHTPGHCGGHISLYSDGILIAGDTVHADDVAWLKTAQLGFEACFQAVFSTLDKLAALPLTISYSGHGEPTQNPVARLDAARRRYERWYRQPDKVAWHATKRIATYYMMLFPDMTTDAVQRYLLSSPWYLDYCATEFQRDPQAMLDPVLDELQRSGAARLVDDRWHAQAPFTPVAAEWLASAPDISEWE